jgi:hypothetical protein
LEAVQIACSRPYNIILMDCNMPIMDGWQVGISERHRKTNRLRGCSRIQASTLQLQVPSKSRKIIYGCTYARTNVLCQHPKTYIRVNKYLHICVSISTSSHVCMVVRVYTCLRTFCKCSELMPFLTGNGENKAHGWSEQKNTNNRSDSQCHEGGSREMHRLGSCLRVCLCVCMCFCVSASLFMCLCMCCESPSLLHLSLCLSRPSFSP